MAAIFIGVAVLMWQLSTAISSAWRQHNAVQEVARAAARDGCMQLDPAALADGRVVLLPDQARAAALDAVAVGLGLLPYALQEGYTPEAIAANPDLTQITVVNASEGSPWTSPWSGKTYTEPLVIVQLAVPSQLFFLRGTVRVQVEDVAFVR
jgi:hypothetical protein